MNNNYSPLRYPGGKGRLIGLMKDVINLNELNGGIYIEPYAGGAALALSLVMDGYMNNIVINDYDKSIFAFWHSVMYHTNELVDKILSTDITIEEWKQQRNVQRCKETASIIDLGFSTFFLNRTNRSGILKAGVIGGIAQNGTYKINARFNKEALVNKILNVASYRDRITVSNFDAIQLISRYRNINPQNLLFLDPPYYVKGRDLYTRYYRDYDHTNLAQVIQRRHNLNWVMTYDEHPKILDLYDDCNITKYQLAYSAGKSRQGTELLISSRELQMPNNEF
ncbi:MAG: DNA adenine methylase [Paludibacteraceae bacterium]